LRFEKDLSKNKQEYQKYVGQTSSGGEYLIGMNHECLITKRMKAKGGGVEV
jgi:hypothetical protein